MRRILLPYVLPIAAVVVFIAALWLVIVLVVSGGRPPDVAVQEFFEARQAGDCEQLLELISEESWSDGGRLSQDEFVDQCDRIVGSYQPELYQADVLSERDDQATVRIEIRTETETDPATPTPGPPLRKAGLTVQESGLIDPETNRSLRLAYEDGQVIREDGQWKIELDQRALGLGRSAEETVWGYLDAYRDGDCEALIGFLSEDAWSEGGEVERHEFLDECAASAEDRASPAPEDDQLDLWSVQPQIAMPQTIDVSYVEDGATALIPWRSGGLGAPPADTTDLVLENLEWRIADGDLDAIRYAELGTHVIDEAFGFDLSSAPGGMVYPDGRGLDPYSEPFSEYEGSDAVRHRQEDGFDRGLAFSFNDGDKYLHMLLYEFEDADGASSYAEHLSDRVVARATEYDDVTPQDISGVDGAVAILTECSGPGLRPRSVGGDCDRANKAAAVAAQGNYVVAVEATDFEGQPEDYPTADEMLGQATEVLKAQLDNL